MLFIFLAILAFVFFVFAITAADANENGWAAALFLISLFLGYRAHEEFTKPPAPPTPEEIAKAEKRKADIEEAKTPKIFSQTNDGCTVYKFVDNGYNHYFTRCDKNVTTDSQNRSGKSTRTESIQTQAK